MLELATMATSNAIRTDQMTLDNLGIGDVDHDDRLIRWMLELTPAQRLEALQNFAEGVAALRYARKVSQ